MTFTSRFQKDLFKILIYLIQICLCALCSFLFISNICMYQILKNSHDSHIYFIVRPLPSSNSIVMIMVVANGSGIVSSNLNLLNSVIYKLQKWSQDAIIVGCQILNNSLYFNHSYRFSQRQLLIKFRTMNIPLRTQSNSSSYVSLCCLFLTTSLAHRT